MRSVIFFLFALLVHLQAEGQTITTRLLDAESGEPIPFATVVTGTNRGTITNEEGYLNLDLSSLEDSSVRLSCMGYESLEVDVNTLENSGLIRLKPAPIELNEVRLGGGVPTAEEIMREVRRNLGRNYPSEASYELFYRESNFMQFDQLDMELEKASDLKRRELEKAQKDLRDFSAYIRDSRAVKFLDFNGQYQNLQDTSLLQVDRVTELLDAKKDFTMEKLQERAQKIILSHLDSTETYKLKTGVFKVEDSLSMNGDFGEDESNDSIATSSLRGKITDVLSIAGLKDGKRLYGFLDGESYRYEFIEPSYFDGNYVYALGFRPKKSKAKFSGTLYIDAATYAILKADYHYAQGRRGEKVNLKLLLGVKYVENMDRGTIIFRRNQEGKYHPYYIHKEYGNYVYLHRSLKFIENSPSKKKVRFDFLMEGGVREKESLLLRQEIATPSEGMLSQSPDKIKIRKLERYEPTIWQDIEIIAPLEEMKNFSVTN
ncbi:MAG: carboxypeptidase-like regulatory domain-containing protein [Flavobacteriaceae bacterium]|nr:MAG: carboxypeptidase-like regulatory domain-containing protein [Flavobacteriaceae bacterium]